MLIPMSSKRPACLSLHLAVVDEGQRQPQPLAPQEHVLVGGQLVDQRQVLVDGVDPLRARVVDALRLVGLAAQEHPPAVLLVEAAEDLDQRRLAGAVVAEQAQDLPLVQGQVDVPQRGDRAEALGDVLDAQDLLRRRARGAASFRRPSETQPRIAPLRARWTNTFRVMAMRIASPGRGRGSWRSRP